MHYCGWNKRWDQWKHVRGGELRGRPARVAAPRATCGGLSAADKVAAAAAIEAAAAAANAEAGITSGPASGARYTAGGFTYVYAPPRS